MGEIEVETNSRDGKKKGNREKGNIENK